MTTTDDLNKLSRAISAAREIGNEELADRLLRTYRNVLANEATEAATPNVGTRGRNDVRYSPNEKLAMRMGWPKTANFPFRIQITEADGKVFVFGVKDGEPFVLTDTADMFPSDQIVTQLRMISA